MMQGSGILLRLVNGKADSLDISIREQVALVFEGFGYVRGISEGFIWSIKNPEVVVNQQLPVCAGNRT